MDRPFDLPLLHLPRRLMLDALADALLNIARLRLLPHLRPFALLLANRIVLRAPALLNRRIGLLMLCSIPMCLLLARFAQPFGDRLPARLGTVRLRCRHGL